MKLEVISRIRQKTPGYNKSNPKITRWSIHAFEMRNHCLIDLAIPTKRKPSGITLHGYISFTSRKHIPSFCLNIEFLLSRNQCVDLRASKSGPYCHCLAQLRTSKQTNVTFRESNKLGFLSRCLLT